MTQQRVKGRQLSATLDDLADVSVPSPTNGQVLTFNAGSWSPATSAAGAAYFTVEDDVAPHSFSLSAPSFNPPTSNVAPVVQLTGPVDVTTNLFFSNSNSFQEYLAQFPALIGSEISNGVTIDFNVARGGGPGQIGAAWTTTVQLSPFGGFGFGFGSFSVDYLSHSANPAFIDSIRVRDDNNTQLLLFAGDGLWPTSVSSRHVILTVVGTSLELTIQGVTAGSFVVARQYKIATVGTTNFVAIGASANTVGTVFTATGVGSGTGVADVFYVVTLPNTIAFPGNKFFRLSITGGGTAGSGTGPGSPGNLTTRFTTFNIAGVPIDPIVYQVDASPTHGSVVFPNMNVVAGAPVTVIQQTMQLLDETNPYGDVPITGVNTGEYPNALQRDATTQVIFNKGMRSVVSGAANQIVTIDAGITGNTAPWLQLYHFNNLDDGPDGGLVTERITGAKLSSQGYSQITPGEYGASALHINPAGGDLDLLPTLAFSTWTMDFSTRKIVASPKVDGRFFTVDRNLPYTFSLYAVDAGATWTLEVRNAGGNLVYSDAGNPYDQYVKWAIQIDLNNNEWSLNRNGVVLFSGTAIAAGAFLFPIGTPASIPWNMQIRSLGGNEDDPDSNGVLLDELRLTPRTLYGIGVAYTPATAEFPVIDVFQDATVLQFINMQAIPYSTSQLAIEPQHLWITDSDNVDVPVVDLPGGNLSIPRVLAFDVANFALTPSGPDNSIVTVTATGGGGSSLTIKNEGTNLTTAATSIDFVGAGVNATNVGPAVTVTITGGGGGSAPANQLVYGLDGALAPLTITNGGTGGTPGVYPDIFLGNITGTGTGAIATITVNGSGVITSVALTAFGYGYQVGDTLSEFGSVGGAGDSIFTVATVQTGTSSSPAMMYDPLTGLTAINYDFVADEYHIINSQFGKILTFSGLVGGTGYVDGTYIQVELVGGSGYEAFADITVAGGVVTTVTLVVLGIGSYGFTVGDTLTPRSPWALGRSSTGGSGFSINVATINAVGINEPNGVYINGISGRSNQASFSGGGSVLIQAGGADFIDGLFGGTVSLRAGEVYSTDVSHNGAFLQALSGAGDAASTIEMHGGDMFFTTGTITSFSAFSGGSGYTNGNQSTNFTGGTGVQAGATFTVVGGVVTALTSVFGGYGYQVGDVLSFTPVVGGGSGFSVTVGSVNTPPPGYAGGLRLTGGVLTGPGISESTSDDLPSRSFGDVTIQATTSDSTDPTQAGRIVLVTGTLSNQNDRLVLLPQGEWEVDGDIGTRGQTLTSGGATVSPYWDYGHAVVLLQSGASTSHVFDGTLFNGWDGITGDQFGSSLGGWSAGDSAYSFSASGHYQVTLEAIAIPLTAPNPGGTQTNWPSDDSVYGSTLSFEIIDPALIFQRRQHARSVTAASFGTGVFAVQRWTDVYTINVQAEYGILATAMQNGTVYRINTVGTTDFTTFGAASNTVGTIFTKSGGAGTGTGIVDAGNFLMQPSLFALSTAGTEDVHFQARMTIRFVGPYVTLA